MSTTTPVTPILASAIALVTDIASRYTKHTRDLKVAGSELGHKLVMTIRGNRDDHPKLVGNKGQHIWALQTILNAAARKAGRAINLTLLDPTVGEKQGPSEFIPNPSWTPAKTLALLEQIIAAVSTHRCEAKSVDTDGLTTIAILPAVWNDPSARWDNGDMAKALHLLIHAIGKTEGRIIHVDVLTPDTKEADTATAAH